MVHAKTKKISLILTILLFFYLSIFPFGQLLSIRSGFLNGRAIHLSDIVVGLIFLVGLFKKFNYKGEFRYLINFWIFLIFSFIISVYSLGAGSLGGILYLLRFMAYSYLMILLAQMVNENKKLKENIKSIFIIITAFIAVFGWLQYIFYPDLTSLAALGWDDHLNRLVSSFLDPTFTGIILVLGILLGIIKYLDNKKLIWILTVLFMASALYLTYSRSSYLALIAGFFYFGVKKRTKIFLIMIIAFIALLPMLPRGAGAGVRLERLHSVVAKIENYKVSADIIKINPLTGVGYNNICQVRLVDPSIGSAQNHACAGFDNSILFLLSTTGLIGFILYFYIFVNINRNTQKNDKLLLQSSALAVLTHSMFANSLFYAWVMGWLFILVGITRKD